MAIPRPQNRQIPADTQIAGVRVPLIVLTVLLAALTVRGADVLDVVVKTDTGASAPRDQVLSFMDCQPGRTFNPAQLSEDIKRIYGSGSFEDVKAEVSEQPDDKVIISVTVTPKRRVRRIIFEGNETLKTKHLKRLIEHEPGAILDEMQVDADTNAIRKRYRQKGFAKCELTSKVQHIPNTHEVNLVFAITENERHKLRKVLFEGNTAFTTAELRGTLLTRRPWWSYIIPTVYVDDMKLEMDEDALGELYTDRGYFDFQVVAVRRTFDAKRKWVTLTFVLEEGPAYTVRSLDLQFADTKRFSRDELLALTKSKQGQQYDRARERRELDRIRAKYDALGYLDLYIDVDHEVDGQSKTVGVLYVVDEGVPSRIHDVKIIGNEATEDYVIRRELALHPGDLADRRKIRASQTRLKNLGYFERVDVIPESTEREDEKNLRVEVTEQHTGSFQVGAGFSTEDALVGTLELGEANFDVGKFARMEGFKGAGQRMRLRMQLGTERNDVVLSFVEPWWLDKRLRLELDAFTHSRFEDEYEQETVGAGIKVTKAWRKYWRHSAGLTVQQIKLTDFEDDVSALLLSEEGNYNATRLLFSVSRDSRDSFVQPTRGSRLTLSTELLTEAIGSYSDIVRLDLAARKYFPLVHDMVLKLGGEVAVLRRISGKRAAIFDRYFAGGMSVRGFKRREISPIDDAVHEEPIGGKSMLLGRAEIIYPIFKLIYGSAFCDAGNVWEDVDDLDPFDLNVSVGAGVQVNLPIGPQPVPVRFEYGWPIVTQMDHLSDSGRPHFHIGYRF